MVDYDLLVAALQARGHIVEHVMSVPKNAGDGELTVDGKVLSLEEARLLLNTDQRTQS